MWTWSLPFLFMFISACTHLGKSSGGGLTTQEVQTVIRKNLPNLGICYETTAFKAGVSGRLTFQFVIDKQGRIRSNKVVRDLIQVPELNACMLDKMASWEFPSPRGTCDVTVRYPFTFEVDGEAAIEKQVSLIQDALDKDIACANQVSDNQDLVLKLVVDKDGRLDPSTKLLTQTEDLQLDLPCFSKLLKPIKFHTSKEVHVPLSTYWISISQKNFHHDSIDANQ